MFRCPNCGQGKEIEFKGTRGENITLTMTDEMKDVEKVFWKHTVYTGEATEKFSKMLMKDSINGQNIKCTKCETDRYTLEEWKEAKTDSLKYLEMDDSHLCHCGGELWMDRIPMTSSYGFVCEKCDWVKPNQKVSGA